VAAILLDATVVRMVLVTAAMKSIGDWSWYLPQIETGSIRTFGGRAPTIANG
jgi:uncharacterized membrane protein YdfJ with MMPL/SSD domain